MAVGATQIRRRRHLVSKNYGWQTAKSGPYTQFRDALMKESGLKSTTDCANHYAEKWSVSRHSVLKWMRGERAIPEKYALKVFGAPIQVIQVANMPETKTVVGENSGPPQDHFAMVRSIYKMCNWCAGDEEEAVCPYWDCPLIKYTNKVVPPKEKALSMRATSAKD
jgi:hypothetical protein